MRPEIIFFTVQTLYFLGAFIGFLNPKTRYLLEIGFEGFPYKAIIFLLLGAIFFCIGSLLADKKGTIHEWKKSIKVLFLLFLFLISLSLIKFVLKFTMLQSFGLALITVISVFSFLEILPRYPYETCLSYSITGIGFLLLNFFYIGGIPFFNPLLKGYTQNLIWGIGFIFSLLGSIFCLKLWKNKSQMILSYFLSVMVIILLALSAYRSQFLVFVFAIFFVFDRKPYLKLLFLTLFSLAVFLSLTKLTSDLDLSMVEILFYRLGFSLSVLENIIDLGIFGVTHGKLWFLKEPRVLLGEMALGYSHNTTATILGTLWLDGGLIESILFMTVIGFLCRMLYELRESDLLSPLYAISISQVLVWIEIGPDLYSLIPIILSALSIKWWKK